MKKLVVTLCFTLIGVLAYSQSTETELIRSAFKLDKKALIADFLQLSNEEGTKFWPVYELYEQERSAIGTRRIKLVEKYINTIIATDKLDEVSADEMVKESASIQLKETKLREKYYKNIKKSVSTSVAARFYQAEDVINVAIRMELYEQLPMLKK